MKLSQIPQSQIFNSRFEEILLVWSDNSFDTKSVTSLVFPYVTIKLLCHYYNLFTKMVSHSYPSFTIIKTPCGILSNKNLSIISALSINCFLLICEFIQPLFSSLERNLTFNCLLIVPKLCFSHRSLEMVLPC